MKERLHQSGEWVDLSDGYTDTPNYNKKAQTRGVNVNAVFILMLQ